MTQQLTSTPIQISSRWSNQIWVENTKYQLWLNKLDAFPLMQAQLSSHRKIKCSSRSQHLTSTWSPTLHLYVKSKLASAVNSQEPNNPNSFMRAAPPNSCAITAAYVPSAEGIKPLLVYPNELHRAQPTLFFATPNPTYRVIW